MLLQSQSIIFSTLLELVMGYKIMLNCRGKYAALKICSVLYFSKTMKNSCKLTLITDSFRQFYQNQSVDGFDLLFEVHITFGFQSEVPHLFLLSFSFSIKSPYSKSTLRTVSIIVPFRTFSHL